jgi:1-acyl-sn-glycerol-3-phosphate acyltransferase
MKENLKFFIAFARSCVFNLVFILIFLFGYVFLVPICLFRPSFARTLSMTISKGVIYSAKYICGLSYRVEGEIPGRPVIVVSNHQSEFECTVLAVLFNYPKFIIKNELWHYPVMGRMCKLWGHIPVESLTKGNVVRQAIEFLPLEVKRSIVEDGRSVVIFPEGERVPYGQTKKCMGGINFIQKKNDCADICPVVHNTGKFWKMNAFVKYPGEIVFKILPLISCDEEFRTINKKIDELFEENAVV